MDIKKIMNYAVKIASSKMYSEKEILEKLRKKFGESNYFSETIKNLKEYSYINDEVYAENYVQYRLNIAPRSKRKLEYELLQKGISKDIIHNVFENTEIDEYSLAEQLSRQKLLLWQNVEKEKQKQRLARFLQSRGFGGDIVYKILKNLI